MRVLITWGTKLSGTEGIARIIGEVLEREGFEVALAPAPEVRDASGYDAAIVGGALYANRWHRDARRFVTRNITTLRRIPVWLFSSGPLDDSADRQNLPPTAQVAVLMERIGARGHTTFGGRLPADAKGLAATMAKTCSGDWRNPERIRAWATDLAHALPSASPGRAIDPPARSLGRLLVHGVVGWALCAIAMAGLLHVASTGVAVALHAVAAPLIFTAIAVRYFRARGARDPLPTALAFTALVGILDAGLVGGLVLRELDMFTSFAGTWLPLLLIFLTTWITGLVMSTMPWPKAADTAGATSGHARGDDDASAPMGA
jgi:menaquinone-dependent protoporphyrinogen oxidase